MKKTLTLSLVLATNMALAHATNLGNSPYNLRTIKGVYYNAGKRIYYTPAKDGYDL